MNEDLILQWIAKQNEFNKSQQTQIVAILDVMKELIVLFQQIAAEVDQLKGAVNGKGKE